MEVIDAFARAGPGPVVGRETEDLDVTLLAWPEGHKIDAHVNAEVDVVMIVLGGEGALILDGVRRELVIGAIAIIPKGTPRAIESGSDDFRYLNVHKRRRRLQLSSTPRR